MSIARLLTATGLLLLVQPPSLTASLVITAYRDKAVYVAGDSLVSGLDGTPRSREKKIFQLGDTCLVSWTGLVRLGPRDKVSQTAGPALSSNAALEKLCQECNSGREPLAEQREKILREITGQYRDCMRWALSNGVSADNLNANALGGALSFAGYDPSSKAFFSQTYYFQGTNEVSGQTNFSIGANMIGASVGFQGEYHFLSALVYGHDKKLTQLCPKQYRRDIGELLSPPSAISEQRLVDCLLELFRLHKQHASRLGYDKGAIGEPYVVYKVTAQKVTQIAGGHAE
jgi:hypothetical protein